MFLEALAKAVLFTLKALQRAAKGIFCTIAGAVSARGPTRWLSAVGFATSVQQTLRTGVNWLSATAMLIAKRASQYDATKANASWASWITEGPGKNSGKLHRLTRVATGWIPSACGKLSPPEGEEADGWCEFEEQELTESQVECADAIPLSGQAEVDCEGRRWGDEWNFGAAPPVLPWPDDLLQYESQLTLITTVILRAAAHTFSADTGLGWDELHPRALARCSDEALMALVWIFVLAERLGRWPLLIGVVLICLIPKAGGGRRPIGLLPSLVRLWMRVRLDLAQAWQSENDRAFFYAGPRKGAAVASWQQAARAELAASIHYAEWACGLLDLVKAFDRVPHDWLVRQAAKFRYPLLVLRLSLAAYRLWRVVTVSGICSVVMSACMGIVAGAVHATIELRVLLLQWAEETSSMYNLSP